MTELQEKLFTLRDVKYADFQSRLIPDLPRSRIIGVRIPELRKIAKVYIKTPECEEFLRRLPHAYYDEDVLHGLIISEIKDYESCLMQTERLLPYIDNWAVCDTLQPKAFAGHKREFLEKIKEWSVSAHSFTCRFGLRMLMCHFLDDDFHPELLELPASVVSDEYYVNMMIAWFFATALAKQWDAALPYIQERRLEKWVHEKTIQKARESFRVSEEHKNRLKALK